MGARLCSSSREELGRRTTSDPAPRSAHRRRRRRARRTDPPRRRRSRGACQASCRRRRPPSPTAPSMTLARPPASVGSQRRRPRDVLTADRAACRRLPPARYRALVLFLTGTPDPSTRTAVRPCRLQGRAHSEEQCRRARPPDSSRCGCDTPRPGVPRSRCNRRRVSTDHAIQLAVDLGVSYARPRRLHARRRSRCGSRRHGMALTARRSVDPRRSRSVLRSHGRCRHPLVVALRNLALGLQSRASEPVAVGIDSQLLVLAVLLAAVTPDRRSAFETPARRCSRALAKRRSATPRRRLPCATCPVDR